MGVIENKIYQVIKIWEKCKNVMFRVPKASIFFLSIFFLSVILLSITLWNNN